MGMSLLHFATMNKSPNNCEIIRILLKKDMDVNLIADDKTTPLHYACATGFHFSSTFIHYVCFYILNQLKRIVLGNPEMVQLLLDAGAKTNINLKDSQGDTPLMYATFGLGRGK